MYYLFVLLIIFCHFLCYIFCNGKLQYKKSFLCCCFFIMLYMQWYRDISIYPDINGYEQVFNRSLYGINISSSVLYDGGFEVGWVGLNILFNSLSDNFDNFLKLIGSIVSASYIYATYHYSKNPLFSILFIMLYPSAFGLSFYVLKQSLAFSIILFALYFINEKKPYKYLCLVFLALSFHYSAIIFIPLYWLKKKIENGITLNFLIFIFLLLIIGTRFLTIISTSNIIGEKYDGYLSSGGNLLPLLLVSLVTIIMIAKNKQIQKGILHNNRESKSNHSYMIVAYCILGSMVCIGIYGTRMDRMALYFTNFLAFSVPMASSILSPILAKILRSAYLIFTLVWVLFSNDYCDINHFNII